MEIKVLGPGCPKCQKTEELVKEAVAESGIQANIIKISDTMEIAKHGIFGTPAIIVDGQVKAMGKVPTKAEIINWIKG